MATAEVSCFPTSTGFRFFHSCPKRRIASAQVGVPAINGDRLTGTPNKNTASFTPDFSVLGLRFTTLGGKYPRLDSHQLESGHARHTIKGIGSTTDAPTEYMKNKQFVTDFYCDDQY